MDAVTAEILVSARDARAEVLKIVERMSAVLKGLPPSPERDMFFQQILDLLEKTEKLDQQEKQILSS